jgi:hypothetical protein
MGKNKSKFDFDSGNILIYMLSKAKILIGVSIVAFIVSAIASILITPKFKSTVIIFPTSTATVSKSVLNTQYNPSDGDILNFGEEEQCDQLMQVLLSNELKDLMNNKYNLMGHYNIDSTKTKYSMTEYYDAFEDNFRFRRSEYLSIIINVFDTDRKLAANMANDVAVFSDTIINRMHKERARKAFILVKNEYSSIDSVINAKQLEINKLTKMGIYDYDYQSRDLTRAYYKALEKGQNQVANNISKRLEVVGKYGRDYVTKYNEINYLIGQRASLYFKCTEARTELEQKLPNKFVVEEAKVSEKKAYPRRTIIVLTSTIAAFFFTLVLLVFVDSIKKHI